MSANVPAVRQPIPAPVSLDDIWKLAQSIAKSGLFGMKTPDQAMALMCIAQAEGRHPALAARDYHIIQGTPAKKAEAMLRDFLESGGRVEWHELADTAADATFSHPAGGTVRIRWDQARIAQAGLGSNPMHKKYPRQMLRSRCVSEGVRTVYPMATSGFYVPEEVAEFGPKRGEPIDVTPVADLDAFAAPHSADPVQGAVIFDNLEAARDAANRGTQAFRDWWKALPASSRDDLRPGLAGYQKIAEDADRKIAEDAPRQPDNEDPFGLPSIGSPQARSEIWGLPHYRLDPAKDLAGGPDWAKWGSGVLYLIGEATPAELDQLQADNKPHMAELRKSDSSDLYREINDAIASRKAEFARAAAA